MRCKFRIVTPQNPAPTKPSYSTVWIYAPGQDWWDLESAVAAIVSINTRRTHLLRTCRPVWGVRGTHPYLISYHTTGVWCTGSDDVGLMQSTKAPKHLSSRLTGLLRTWIESNTEKEEPGAASRRGLAIGGFDPVVHALPVPAPPAS